MSDELCILRLANRCATDEEPEPGPRRATFGRICGSCARRFETAIAEAPALLDDLALMLRRQGRTTNGRVSGTGEEPPFISEHVVKARRELLGVLEQIARVVVDGRGFHPPRDSAEAVCVFLLSNLEWLALQEEVVNWARVLDTWTRWAKSSAFPSGSRHIELRAADGTLVRCIEAMACDVATREPTAPRCDGVLEAVVRQTDHLLPSQITCSECGKEIPAAAWVTFGRHWRQLQKVA